MISLSELNAFKTFANLQVNLIPGGTTYVIIEEDIVTWKLSSDSFDIPGIKVGEKLADDAVPARAIRERKTITVKIPREYFGIRLIMSTTPVVNDDGIIVGTFTIASPRLHPFAAGFPHFAPILSEMFPEGSFLYVTDLKKCILRQSSRKFDIPSFSLGYELKETDMAIQTIKSKNPSTSLIDSKVWGMPIIVMNYPMFDEDNPDLIVGTFGIALPKATAEQLREMSNNLNYGLTGISSAIEELTASASQIHSNERQLNSTLQEVYKLSEEINAISTFIEGVSNQTKMLGLNASIEAARAGEAGKGFNVVAKEIRKLSDQSRGTVPKIKEIIENIKNKLVDVSKLSETSLEASQDQSSASEEITASIEEMTTLSSELNNLSQNV